MSASIARTPSVAFIQDTCAKIEAHAPGYADACAQDLRTYFAGKSEDELLQGGRRLLSLAQGLAAPVDPKTNAPTLAPEKLPAVLEAAQLLSTHLDAHSEKYHLAESVIQSSDVVERRAALLGSMVESFTEGEMLAMEDIVAAFSEALRQSAFEEATVLQYARVLSLQTLQALQQTDLSAVQHAGEELQRVVGTEAVHAALDAKRDDAKLPEDVRAESEIALNYLKANHADLAEQVTNINLSAGPEFKAYMQARLAIALADYAQNTDWGTLNAFNNSPAGKELTAATEQLMPEANPLLQAQAARAQEKLLAEVEKASAARQQWIQEFMASMADMAEKAAPKDPEEAKIYYETLGKTLAQLQLNEPREE